MRKIDLETRLPTPSKLEKAIEDATAVGKGKVNGFVIVGTVDEKGITGFATLNKCSKATALSVIFETLKLTNEELLTIALARKK